MCNIIKKIDITEELKRSFISYSLNVITGRAIPDIRDGLKPVHRRIIFAMYKQKNTYEKKFSKCAGIVGEVLKKYHPHGDEAVYSSLVKLSQDWNINYPLIKGQGNFGSIDGDPPAAYRYTEAKLSEISNELIEELNHKAIKYKKNFDSSTIEPKVLPVKFPLLLINGSEGIAVGLSTKCPSFNLREISNAVIYIVKKKFIKNKKINKNKILKLIKGPDFPTGGSIKYNKEIKNLILTGKGNFKIKGKIEKNVNKIFIKEIPYQINKKKIIEEITKLIKEQKLEDITNITDESDKKELKITIHTTKKANIKNIKKTIYKNTNLKISFPANILAIKEKKPVQVSVIDVIEGFINFRKKTIKKKTKNELNKIKKRLIKVIIKIISSNNIKNIIKIIKEKKIKKEIINEIKNLEFKLPDFINKKKSNPLKYITKKNKIKKRYIEKIINSNISNLIEKEKKKIYKDFCNIKKEIKKKKKILKNKKNIFKIICKESKEIKKKYYKKRKTKIKKKNKKQKQNNKNILNIILFSNNKIEKNIITSIKTQEKGTRGKKIKKNNEKIKELLNIKDNEKMLFFTNQGRIFKIETNKIINNLLNNKQNNINNYINLKNNEEIKKVLIIKNKKILKKKKFFILTCSKNGKIKKTEIKKYENINKNGIISCNLKKKDELVDAIITNGFNDIIIYTKKGFCIRINEIEIKESGRNSEGINCIKLKENDEIIKIENIKENPTIIIATEQGYCKKNKTFLYKKQKKKGKGKKIIKLKKEDNIVKILKNNFNEEIVLITNKGNTLKIKTKNIKTNKINRSGNKVIKIKKEKEEILENIINYL